jgi:hypothetical protein
MRQNAAFRASAYMSGTVVSEWFGLAFEQLHPLLQSLHRHGGKLRGPIDIGFGQGLSGIAGRRLARRLGIPCDGNGHMLEVTIDHRGALLHWDRRLDDGHGFRSTFRPYGRWPDGGWIEDTAAIALRLQVEVIDGGWYWRCIGAQLGRWRLPRWLLPRSEAYKRIEDGRYRFSVSFALPLLGEIVSYGGLLDAVPAPLPARPEEQLALDGNQ